MGLIFSTVLLIIFLWSLSRWKFRASLSLAKKIPSNKWHTFLGWGKVFSKYDLLPYLAGYLKKYGKNSIMWMGPLPIFLTIDPQCVKDILTSKNCADKPAVIYHGMSFVIGEGIISSKDPSWSEHRKLLNKAFNYKIVLSFLPISNKVTNRMIEEIHTSLHKGETVDMLLNFRKITLKATSQTVLKRDIDLTKYDSTAMTVSLTKLMEYIITCCVSPSMRIGFVAKMADTFLFKKSRDHVKMVEKYVDESMDIVQRSDTTDPSYLPEVNGAVDFALEGLQQNLINVEEIKGEVMHLFTAAFDTTSYTLFLAVVLLAMHSEFQERAHEEIVSILGDDDKELTVEQLDQMVFLEMVFNETLRLFPAGPTIARQVSHENVTLTNGLTLPVGQTICIDTYSLHRDKDIWGPAANSFNPENFLPSNVETRHAYAYIPFTKGVRFCIGWKYAYLFAKVTLAKAIKHFKFSTDAKYEELVAENQTTLKLIKDPQIFLEKRT